MVHANHHRMQIIAHGSEAERQALLANASPHLIGALSELLAAMEEHSAHPKRHAARVQILSHPDASLEDKREALTGGGFGDFLKSAAKGLTGAIGGVAKVAETVAPILPLLAMV